MRFQQLLLTARNRKRSSITRTNRPRLPTSLLTRFRIVQRLHQVALLHLGTRSHLQPRFRTEQTVEFMRNLAVLQLLVAVVCLPTQAEVGYRLFPRILAAGLGVIILTVCQILRGRRTAAETGLKRSSIHFDCLRNNQRYLYNKRTT